MNDQALVPAAAVADPPPDGAQGGGVVSIPGNLAPQVANAAGGQEPSLDSLLELIQTVTKNMQTLNKNMYTKNDFSTVVKTAFSTDRKSDLYTKLQPVQDFHNQVQETARALTGQPELSENAGVSPMGGGANALTPGGTPKEPKVWRYRRKFPVK